MRSIEEDGMVNRQNYRWARAYLEYLAEVTQLDRRSVERYWFYLKPLLIWADDVLLSQASQRRPAFPAYLAATRQDDAADLYAPSTLRKIIRTTKRFLLWLKMTYVRDFRDLPMTWIDALRPPRGIEPPHDHQFINVEDVQRLIAIEINEGDLALRRDQAAAAMLFLSGMRAGAFGTLPIRAVDLPGRTIRQWPSLKVHTKKGKSATTYLLDIPELLTMVERWDTFIRAQLPPTAMWYTPIAHQWGEQSLSAEAPGAHRNIAIAKRLRLLFEQAGVPYQSPHKFRHGHAVYALQHAKTMADYKAVSMNLMHEDIRVTDGIYAPLAGQEVQQRIAGLTRPSIAKPAKSEGLADFIRSLPKEQLADALMAIAEQMPR
jgi:integrase